MHQPQLTQLLSPIGLLSSNEMLVRFPLPIRPMTRFWATSVQARTHRSHRMQALWSIAIDGLEKSVPFEYARGVKGETNTGPAGATGRDAAFFALPLVGGCCCGWAAGARGAGLISPSRSPSTSSSQ